MLLLAAVSLIAAITLVAVMPRVKPSWLNSIVRAAAATAPVATAILVFRPGMSLTFWEIVLTFLGLLAPAFAICAFAVTVIGVPLSLALDRLGYSSRRAYIFSGTAVASTATVCFLFYDWCCVSSGPFMPSFMEKVSIFGAQAVLKEYLFFGASAVLCASIAANFYWTGRAVVSPDNSMERTREG
jgi:hypothetical protein